MPVDTKKPLAEVVAETGYMMRKPGARGKGRHSFDLTGLMKNAKPKPGFQEPPADDAPADPMAAMPEEEEEQEQASPESPRLLVDLGSGGCYALKRMQDSAY